MRPKFLLFLIAAGALWAAPAAAEDPGKARVEIHLKSKQSIPDDVREALFDKMKVAIRCDGKKISDEVYKVGTPKKKPEIRGLSANLPPGDCTILTGIEDSKARVALKMRAGKTTRGKIEIELGWARVSADPILEGDRVFLVWTDSKDRTKAVTLSAEPTLMTLRDYSYVLEHDGARGEPVPLPKLKGDTTVTAYGSVVFSSGVLLDSATVTVDGNRATTSNGALLLPLGKHSVLLEATAHRPVTKDVDLRAGRPYKWSTRLSKARPGKITFEVEGPAEFVLKVDSVDIDTTAEVVLDTGPHVVSIKADGWNPLTETLTVVERETRSVSYTLVPSSIAVTIGPLPEGARVRITPPGGSAQDLPAGGESAKTTLAPGTYRVHVEADEHVSFDGTLTLEIGDGSASLTPDMPSTVVDVTWTGLPSGAALTLEEPGTEPRGIRVRDDGTARAKVVAGDVAWRVEKSGYLTVADTLDLAPGDPEQEIAVDLPVDLALRGRIRTIVMAGAAGGTGVAGIVLLGASGGSYKQSIDHHDLYLSSTDPDEIVQAKVDRDAAVLRGEGEQVAGVILVAAGVGTAAATVLLLLLDKKKQPNQLGAIVVPTDGGFAFGLSGRW